jgi:hypothetical protein
MDNQMPFEPKSVEFVIDDVTYTKKELLVTERNILLFKLAQLAGASGEGIGNLDDNMDFGKMLMGVLFKYTPEQAASFIKETIMAGLEYPNFKHGSPDPKQPNYEKHFTQYYPHQIQVLQEIWEQNFGESIDLIKKKLATSSVITRIFSLFKEEIKPKPEDSQSPDSADKK